ncbi:MAG: hypothetical protein IJJ85_03180, partial [Clostridia bacterium]|nr:hypothetical protein [Clostridia bacterium]
MKKTMRTVLSLLLAVLMVVSALPLAGVGVFTPAVEAAQEPGGGSLSGYQVGDIIQFGGYPASCELMPRSDPIHDIPKGWTPYFYFHEDEIENSEDGGLPDIDMMLYAIVPYNDDLYMAVMFNAY